MAPTFPSSAPFVLARATTSPPVSNAPTDIHVHRLPRTSPHYAADTELMPADTPHTMPHTNPDHPWDRIAFAAATPVSPLWRTTEEPLSAPLPEDAPSPASLVGHVVIHAIEILQGHRPASQLRHWLTPEVFAALSRRAGLAYRIKGRAPKTLPPRVRRIHSCMPQERAVEAAVVVFDGQKIRAAALRMEYRRSRWITTALEIG